MHSTEYRMKVQNIQLARDYGFITEQRAIEMLRNLIAEHNKDRKNEKL